MHLFASNMIDDVIIGNAYASEAELKALFELNRYQLKLHVNYVSDINEIEKTIVEKPQHFRRNELQIVLEPHKEPRMNKVGSISSDELFLLDFIKPWSKFKLTSK